MLKSTEVHPRTREMCNPHSLRHTNALASGDLENMSDQQYKVFHHPISQPSRSVLMFMKANSIPHEAVYVDLFKGEHKQPEFLKVNPVGAVPALVDASKNLHLAESAAILTYLHNTNKTPDHWYPEDPVIRAQVDEYMHWHHGGLRKPLLEYYVQKVMMPLVFNKPMDEKSVEEKLAAVKSAVEKFEKRLEDRDYIAGERMSIADLQALNEFSELVESNVFPDLNNYKNVQDWYNRVKSEMQPHFDATHSMVYEMGEKVNGSK